MCSDFVRGENVMWDRVFRLVDDEAEIAERQQRFKNDPLGRDPLGKGMVRRWFEAEDLNDFKSSKVGPMDKDPDGNESKKAQMSKTGIAPVNVDDLVSEKMGGIANDILNRQMTRMLGMKLLHSHRLAPAIHDSFVRSAMVPTTKCLRRDGLDRLICKTLHAVVIERTVDSQGESRREVTPYYKRPGEQLTLNSITMHLQRLMVSEETCDLIIMCPQRPEWDEPDLKFFHEMKMTAPPERDDPPADEAGGLAVHIFVDLKTREFKMMEGAVGIPRQTFFTYPEELTTINMSIPVKTACSADVRETLAKEGFDVASVPRDAKLACDKEVIVRIPIRDLLPKSWDPKGVDFTELPTELVVEKQADPEAHKEEEEDVDAVNRAFESIDFEAVSRAIALESNQ